MNHFSDEAVNRSPSSRFRRNVVGCGEPEMLEEVRVADEGTKATTQITKQFRKALVFFRNYSIVVIRYELDLFLFQRNTRRRGGNGLCPPHPPEDVPVVNWSEPSEIKHIFPKTYNYVVGCIAHKFMSLSFPTNACDITVNQ